MYRSNNFNENKHASPLRLDALFQPLNIRGVKLKNRLMLPPLVTGFCIDGMITPRVLNYYGERADHGIGLIIVESGMVDVTTMGFMNLGIYDDKFLPGLKQLVERIHSGGALSGIQLQHCGREWEGKPSGVPCIAPSPIPWSPGAEIPQEMSMDDIKKIIRRFAEASRRAKLAGFDMIEVHGAHGYLIGEFLSLLSNQRTDEYGGSLNNRARFAIEVVKAVREEVGPGILLSFRINGSDNIAGGCTVEDAKVVANMVVEAGVDLISVSAGVYGSYPTIIPPFDMPHGCYVPFAEQIKKIVNVPVAVAGRLDDLLLAKEVIESGKSDLIALARPLVADPQLPEKAENGKVEDIRKCLACCRCADASYEEAGIVCTVNPAVGREEEFTFTQTEQRKRVLIIGGGLAGLEAARVASLRGHQVSLYEEADQLGGQWLLAAIPPGKQEFAGLVEWLVRQVTNLGVRIHTGERATPEIIDSGKPDVVILATGAEPLTLALPGLPSGKVYTAWDILRTNIRPEQRILVVGGSGLGLETADYLAHRGHKVIVAEKLPHVGRDMPGAIRFHLIKRLRRQGVEIMRSTEVVRGLDNEIISRKDNKELRLGIFDMVVTAVGSRARDGLAGALKGKAREVYIIGDASKPRQATDAIREGAEIGRKI